MKVGMGKRRRSRRRLTLVVSTAALDSEVTATFVRTSAGWRFRSWRREDGCIRHAVGVMPSKTDGTKTFDTLARAATFFRRTYGEQVRQLSVRDAEAAGDTGVADDWSAEFASGPDGWRIAGWVSRDCVGGDASAPWCKQRSGRRT